jgi:hypothetical protein
MARRFKDDYAVLVNILKEGRRIGPNNKVEIITYDSFCTLVSQRVNVYQLGLTMMYILTHVSKPIMAIRKNGRQLYDVLREFFYQMMHPNVFERLSSLGPPSILDRYNEILIYFGMIVNYKNKKDSGSFELGPLITNLKNPMAEAMQPMAQAMQPVAQAMQPIKPAIQAFPLPNRIVPKQPR